MSNYTHYKKFIDLRGDGRIVLYQRADHQNPKWTVRIKIPRVQGFVVRSSKTTDEHEARRFAEDLYYELEGRARRGEPISSPSFYKVFDLWQSSLTDKPNQGKPDRYTRCDIRRVELWALKFFAETTVDQITEGRLVDYAEWRMSQPKRPALSTVRNERTALRKLLTFAKRKRFIKAIPEFRIKSSKRNARPDIPEAEWKKLCRFIPQYLRLSQDRRRQRERLYLVLYVQILANTGIRVGEARSLKWHDISSTRTLTGDVRAILSVSGKTGYREVVGNKGTEQFLELLRAFRTEEIGILPPPNEPVFCSASGKRIGSFKGGFNRLLKEAGILHGPDGKRRVPYSLRHTYATMRLAEGVSVFQLAANMGTSVEMIEDFYGKKRTSSPKFATELTKVSLYPIIE